MVLKETMTLRDKDHLNKVCKKIQDLQDETDEIMSNGLPARKGLPKEKHVGISKRGRPTLQKIFECHEWEDSSYDEAPLGFHLELNVAEIVNIVHVL
jgi:hypothetical protein